MPDFHTRSLLPEEMDEEYAPIATVQQALGEIERCGAACVVAEQVVELFMECDVEPCGQVRLLEFFERAHQNFWHEPPAIGAEVAVGVWL